MFENWQKLVSSNKIDLVHEKITYYKVMSVRIVPKLKDKHITLPLLVK